jgi:uncharacterized protein YbjT (DUF2867 family)
MAKNAPRTALLVGATGLTGAALLPLLVASPRYARVHVLSRRPLAKSDARLEPHVVDFDALDAAGAFPRVDDVYCCLGTTIRVAGSQAAFRKVDFDYVVDVARRAREAGATRFAVVSAMGASRQSLVFYSRVKGEMEAAVAALGFESVTIVRPSFLDGQRAEKRPGEGLALALARVFEPLILKRYRAVPAVAVARAMLHFTLEGAPGVAVVPSDRLLAFRDA